MQKIKKEELKSIFLKIKENDTKGLEELYIKYHNIIYGIAFSITKNKEDAEDIMQMVFTKIQEIDKTKLPSDKEMTWIYTLTKNETFNYVKKKKREISLDTIYEIQSENHEIDETIDRIQFNQWIHNLNEKEKEIISLKVIANFSFKEISKLVDEPIGTVKWRYYKSLRSIKGMLGSLAMFIITLKIGVKTLVKEMKTKQEEQKILQSEDTEHTTKEEASETQNSLQEDSATNYEDFQDNEQHKEIQDIIQEENTTKGETGNKTEELKNEKVSNTIIQEDEIKQEIRKEDTVQNQNTYIGITMLGISIIFFIMTIIFFIKYQLKTKKKLSK